MGLIDMNGGLGRVDGGIGISLEEPCYQMSFDKSSEIEGLLGGAEEIAQKVCQEIGADGISVKIKHAIPKHVGFGSKTQLFLGIAAGIYKTYGIQKPIEAIAEIVGRGGTSGIGVAAFDRGGLIVDCGHPAQKGFKPSSCSKESPPRVLIRQDFPWHFVCAWPDSLGVYGTAEADVFERYCPIPSTEVDRLSRIILVKLLPAMMEKDIASFGKAVNLMQEVGFKRYELALKKDDVGDLLAYLQKETHGAGMSSFGPVCYGVCEREIDAESIAKDLKDRFESNVLVTKANNMGAIWQ